MKYRTVKWARTKIRLPEVVEWQGHKLKLARHDDAQWANWYFRDERITLHLMRWLNSKDGDRDAYSLSINWEFDLRLQPGIEISMTIRESTMEKLFEKATIALNDLFETLPKDFPE